jgi:hypothetical protein
MIPSSFETAKYNREQEMKEIHLNFMKQYDTTKKKVRNIWGFSPLVPSK